MQGFPGVRAGGFQNVVLAVATRTFVSNSCKCSLVLMDNVPVMVLWNDSGLSGRNSYVDSRC
eukprot:682945-Pyramimonas_sp.AAC.1